MKKLYLLFILVMPILSPSALSQDYNEEFLESLPENIVEDLQFQSRQNEQEDKFDYSNPDTRITKLESALEKAERTLAKIRIDIDTESQSDAGELKRFGDDFFRTFQSSFSPINNQNITGEYILDTGDQLTIQLVGQKNNIIEEFIQRDGSLFLEEVGSVMLAGLNLQEANALIELKVNQSFAGVETYLSLSEFRGINVLITGNAENPGIYTLQGGSSPLALVHAAGGITKEGSFRSISHMRKGKLVQNIDLYNILIDGNLTFANQLRSGDSIVVHQKLNEVRMSGGFAKPGIYEFNNKESLEDLLSYSGLKASYVKKMIQIERLETDFSKRILFVDIADAKQTVLKNGDSVEIYSVEPKFNSIKTVSISGEINIPGNYSVSDSTKLSDLLGLAGGYTTSAYPLGGIFSRESVKQLENETKESGYNELIRYLVSSPGFGSNSVSGAEGLVTFLSLLKDYQPSGRMITEFELSELKKNPILDRILQNGDAIHIPAFTPEVFVFGEVMSPGPVNFQETNNPKDYIKKSGGFSRVADTKRIVVISPDGRSQAYKSSLFSLDNTQVLPGSLIYIPREIGKVDGLNLAATLSPIFSSVALSIASLNSISD
ncbi:SLBB domain-containing protein [Gammaproteobacteria bacterium]|nr:SLBB domain-containing protein [Gammaproteobacteria bacterium]